MRAPVIDMIAAAGAQWLVSQFSRRDAGECRLCARRCGLKVGAWTVNAPRTTMVRLMDLDAICTGHGRTCYRPSNSAVER